MISSIFRFIKKLAFLVVCLIALIIGALFAYENPSKVAPIVYGFTMPNLSLGYYLVAVLIVGILVGLLLTFWSLQSRKLKFMREISRLKKEVRSVASENKELKAQAQKALASADVSSPSALPEKA